MGVRVIEVVRLIAVEEFIASEQRPHVGGHRFDVFPGRAGFGAVGGEEASGFGAFEAGGGPAEGQAGGELDLVVFGPVVGLQALSEE